jgi:hypothetical protein
MAGGFGLNHMAAMLLEAARRLVSGTIAATDRERTFVWLGYLAIRKLMPGESIAVKKALQIFVLSSFFFLLMSCANTNETKIARGNSLPSIEGDGTLAEGNGVLLVSTGRMERATKEDGANFAGNLPFVSYDLYKVEKDGSSQKMAFVPAERLGFGDLGKEVYGFVHFFELPEGHYIAIGSESRGVIFVAPGVIMFPGSGSTGIAITFSVDQGVVNYVGEWATMRGFLRTEDIRIEDKRARDLEFLYRKSSDSRRLPVRVALGAPATVVSE